ncbi:response regulator [Desulfomonile tiedjei]|uniref:Response regulator with CheY-like receiver, AAA-type ATPase, and DNA-binding domains n=1 Tax=Desulfomonile tiedjei (strain ATCC 49306 / DSM 6799 / DCB-1) TaxID=706587 RepID=I4CBP2_DESTA|nr:response regulator [Desulfomonile tiedjei]AFM26983.1 response regulator with CheY-like receiver, AAA-type ATPase, and DNA-binding domains [Desulfomonile tiedjei DSM 6799]
MIANVLLVDDEAPFVEALAKRLEKRGVTISTAMSGPEALEKLKEKPNLDIVVLDVKMPGMDGIDTLKAIKAERPMVEVIMLTGHATVESAIEGMKLGALDYLMKPCEMEILMAKLQEAKAKKTRQEDKIAEARAMNIALRRGD